MLSQGQLELSGSANNEDNNNNKKSVSCLSGGDTSSMRQDLESPPDHPARTSHAYGSDDWSDRELHHQQQEQQQQQQLTLSQFTPPTSLNDTPTKLFFRYGDSSALDHVDPLVLTPVNTRFNNYTTPLVSPTLLAPMSPFLSTQLVASNMMMMPTTITTHNGIQMHHERQPNAAGSGISTGTTNAAPSSSFLVGSTASSSTSSSVTGRHPQHQPVLYSAIGSLEHPTNSFYKGMRSRAFASTHKFDFPSSSSMLLAPPLHVAAARKQRNALENSNSATNMNIHTINGNVVNATKNNAVTQPRKQQQQTKSLKQVNKSAQKQGLTSALKNIGGKTGGVDDDESKSSSTKSGDKKVTIVHNNFSTTNLMKSKARKSRKQRGPIEMFRPSSDAYTPRMGKKEIKYKPAGMRTPVQQMASPLGTLSRPNFRDALRRVAMIIHQHIVKIELRFESKKSDHRVSSSGSLGAVAVADDGLFSESMKEAFSEDRYITPRYKCTMVRVPMARSGMVCGLKHIRENYAIPSEAEIYEFAHRLFKTVQLSSECSIVCLIYVERLMEAAKVPLLASTWRPIFMCGLLLASKVWQDLSSWNIEFASVYPQYSLSSINRLELQFLRMVQWDLYISSSQYAKYYFALRSLVEKPDFRQRYNRMVGGVDTVHASQARKIEERSSMVKEEALLHLSRSM